MESHLSKIKIAEEFTDTPGARHKSDGEFSGEEFREKLLRPKFYALKEDDKLLIDFDGVYGYPPSFLEEAFGGLVREVGSSDNVENKLILKAEEEPNVVNEVIKYIRNALQKKK